MDIIINTKFDIWNLHKYIYSKELISDTDKYTMHTISKKRKNNPMNEIVNILFYDKKLNKTPEEISVDTVLSEIIDITFFTYESQRDENLLDIINVIEHDEAISISIDKKNVIFNNLKIERDLNLRWFENNEAIYIVFNNINDRVHSYFIGDNCKILLNEHLSILGFKFEFKNIENSEFTS